MRDPRCPTCGEVGRRGIAFRRRGDRFYFRGRRVYGWRVGEHRYEAKGYRRGLPSARQLAAYCPDRYHRDADERNAVNDYRRARAAPWRNFWKGIRGWK